MSDSSSGRPGFTPTGDAEASTSIREAVKSILANLKIGSDLAEIERTLNVVKLGSEIQKIDAERAKAEQDAKKATIDAGLASRQLRHSLIGSMLAPLIPLTSLATVMVTLYVASEQMRITRDQAREKIIEDKAVREEASWKAFEDDLNKSSADALYSSGTFVSRLRAFDAAGNHKLQLRDINKQFMGRLSSDSAFKDIWQIAFKETTSDNFDAVVELARGRKRKYDQIIADCQAIKLPDTLPVDPAWTGYFGGCSSKYSNQDLTKTISDPATLKALLSLRESMNNTFSIQWFLSTQISGYIKEVSSKVHGGKVFDLSDVALIDANLDDVDFSKMNLAQARFDYSTVKDALLTGKSMTYDFRATPWWEANAIDQSVLSWLIRYGPYPEISGITFPTTDKITRDQYQAKIDILCTSKLKICSKACVRFGPQAPVPPRECED